MCGDAFGYGFGREEGKEGERVSESESERESVCGCGELSEIWSDKTVFKTRR